MAKKKKPLSPPPPPTAEPSAASVLPSEAVDFRKAVKDRLAELDKKTFWLVQLADGRPKHAMIYTWLSGKSGMTCDDIERLLGLLGLDVKAVRAPRTIPPKPPATPPEMPV